MIESNYRLLIVSTSKIYGSAYMEYLLQEVEDFFKGIDEITFIPYARPGGISYDDYTQLPRKAFAPLGIKVKGLHQYSSPQEGLARARAIFIGGGNTFVLLHTLYEFNLLSSLRERVKEGIPYMGSSAGSNIAGLSIGTSNDMPIIHPPAFKALGFLPFNLNPHYLDPSVNSRHMGETRETRIQEFHCFNPQPVLGLREGSWIRVQQGKMELRGPLSARLFLQGEEPRELAPGELHF